MRPVCGRHSLNFIQPLSVLQPLIWPALHLAYSKSFFSDVGSSMNFLDKLHYDDYIATNTRKKS